LKRYRYKNAGAKIQLQIWNLVDEFHKKITKWACKITILYSYPNLRPGRWFLKVREKSTQKLLEICLFRVFTDSGHNWWTRPEKTQTAELLEYTCQIYSKCRFLHSKIRGSKELKCPQYNQESDRGFNAARNILLKKWV
jgi:transposase